MKKILFIITVAITFMGVTNVSALEMYYTNSNNVSFTKEEYDFISKILWDGYQESMTTEDYNNILKDGISNNIQRKEYLPIMPFATSHTTNSKSLVITKATLPSYTLISVTLTWLGSPVVRSYDLIGAYLDGVSVTGGITTKVTSTAGTSYSSYIKNDTNGFGVSIKLPDPATDIKVSQVYKVTGSGNVYASYQHATSNISLNNSQKYTISRLGSGGVFLFDSSIYSYYDHMGGVNIAV